MNTIKNVVYVIVIIFIVMNLVMNDNLKNKINKILDINFNKINISVRDIVLALVIVAFVLSMVKLGLKTKENFKFYVTLKEKQDKIVEECDKKVAKQTKIYIEIMKMVTDIEKCKNPYIPDGFEYVEGEWNNGFVIEDKNKNQFVWIPCTNKKNDDNIPILKKKNFLPDVFINCFSCYDDDYEKFLESALKNGGFYVSRFEIGKENEKPVSKIGVSFWGNILYNDAKNLAYNMYTNINSSLMNGYAYDTMLSFVYDEIKNEQEPQKGKEKTGTKPYKKIYDILDDNFEWTIEGYYTSAIYRGSSSSNNVMELNYLDNRFSSNIDFTSENKGFRVMIY